MITDFLYSVINKTFKYIDICDNESRKIHYIKKIFRLSSKKIILEPEFYKTNYDYFIIDDDTDLSTVNFKNIYKLEIDIYKLKIDISNLKHLYKLTLINCPDNLLSVNFKNIRFIQLNQQEIPSIYKKTFYNSIKNAYRVIFTETYIDCEYLQKLTNIHIVSLFDTNNFSDLKNNYVLDIRGTNIFLSSVFFSELKYIYCEIDCIFSIIIKKSQYDFTIKRLYD